MSIYHPSLADKVGDASAPLFRSFFLGGFECSAHVSKSGGRRLDLIAATGHDRFAREDYGRLRQIGIRSARDGIRWHLIETAPYRYDWSSALPLVRAARDAGVQVIWDLCHYGWPDDLDIFSPEFLDRFAALTRAFVHLLSEETEDVPYLSPMNEISYVAWAGGESLVFPPFVTGRGHELKGQLVRAAIAACDAAWTVRPDARIFHIDPMCNVVPSDPDDPTAAAVAESYRTAQYEGWDMLSGRLRPELGGRPEYLDVVGVNYYPDNQWVYPGDPASSTTIGPDHPLYRPVPAMLQEVYERYGRPLFVAETGTEDDARAGWLRHVCDGVEAAVRASVPVEGICLYPILNHPGWEDDRHCRNGLWDYADENGAREAHEPLARELAAQQRRFLGLVGY